MAYGRNQGNGGGYSRGGNQQSRGGGQYNGGRGSGGGAPRGGQRQGGGGSKPDFRLAEMTEQDGKKVTVKDPTTGKTVYIGAMWSNPYGGFNVEIELDGQKIRARAFPTDDDRADRQQDQQPPQGGGRGGRQQRGDDQDDED